MTKDNILLNILEKYCIYLSIVFLCFTVLYFVNLFSVVKNIDCNDCKFFINDKCVSKLDYDNLIDRLCKDGRTYCSNNNITSGRIYIKHEVISD